MRRGYRFLGGNANRKNLFGPQEFSIAFGASRARKFFDCVAPARQRSRFVSGSAFRGSGAALVCG
jgi:hypothetical protein